VSKLKTINKVVALFVLFAVSGVPLMRASSPSAPVGVAQSQFEAKLAAFEQFVQEQMQKDKIPGLTIGFFKDDYTWVKAFGYADVENKIPARPESAYRLASITKTFTGAAIIQLVEKGKMSLDAEIQTYLPSYPKQKWPVTVRQLLVHLGGGQTGSGIGPEYVTPREVVGRIARYPIQNEPGVKFDYQTSGYNLLGAAIEEVTGKPLGEYLRESIWGPLGMSDTRMDSVRELIPNRVRGYEFVNGAIRNARFIDVSSRFGGGGALGTVPDLLKWARSVDSGVIMSKESTDLMYSPVANKGGRYVGLADGSWYYTAGWLVFPINGQMAIWNDGGQIGTNTALLRVPSRNLAIAFACNVQEIDRIPYMKRLYELITSEPMSMSVATRSKFDDTLYRAVNDTFNYGAMYFDRKRQPSSADPKELNKAFVYFNKVVDRAALQADSTAGAKAIDDGRHPVADTAFIKVGSYMAMKLAEKNGNTRAGVYRAMGAPAFFDDYIKLYKTNRKHPKDLRFRKPFELMVQRWNQDWSRTWTAETRRLTGASAADIVESGEQLKKTFAGVELYPNLIDPLLNIRPGPGAWKAAKLAVELYPQSPRTNLVWGLFLILLSASDIDAALVEKSLVQKEPPLVYLKRSAELDAGGPASPGSLRQVARSWMGEGRRPEDAEKLLKIAIELHPQSGLLYEGLGEVYSKQGLTAQAIDSYKKAVQLDPKLEQAADALKKLNP
jgi:CubicO group peptidase (beta-lactamase class C family)